ncbi:MAG: bifunctional 2-polyprenyl-6-hydroxyphenol methylase/3-demethylubiquinol 3-O-methyltransferase UbiG [Betaproteobacteria bacterium]|nr:bifunctional 2-polyprenyl-6-hydroxyphenol methylase/3-demethylubiquinol 3-O-methyltransferase UbiG [Betaproteobacteria bacterium]
MMASVSCPDEQFGSDGWWEAGGSHSLLRVFAPVRCAYMRERLGELGGRKIADVGCGGGIFSEQLAAAGALVTGVDPSPSAIEAARAHAAGSGLEIDYRAGSAADLESAGYDAVVCSEVLEHASDPAALVEQCAALLVAGGSLIVSTINRNPLAYAAMIVGMEKVLGALPEGSHNYRQFITPDELSRQCSAAGLKVADIAGANWSFFGKTFLLSRSWMPVNYLLHAKKSAVN